MNEREDICRGVLAASPGAHFVRSIARSMYRPPVWRTGPRSWPMPGGTPDVLLLGSGGEVALCVAAYEQLEAESIKAWVVSMPSWELFERQSQDYRESVLPPDVTARVAVEQASTFSCTQCTGCGDAGIGMKTFSASAPLKELQRKFGFKPDQIVAAAKAQVGRAHGLAVSSGTN